MARARLGGSTVLVLSLSLALLAAACGGGNAGGTTTTTLGTTTAGPTSTTVTTSTPTTVTTTIPVTTTTLLGTATSVAAGEVLVVGVRYDDVLNVRSGPGVGFDVVTTLAPTATATATGQAFDLERSRWIEVEAAGTVGWVDARFVAYPGSVDDRTADVVAAFGAIPTAPTVLGLGLLSASRFVSDEPTSDVVVVQAPTFGDLAEVVVDVIGLGDDAVRGLRLHVFASSEDGGVTWGLRSLEVWTLCGRGATDDGLCV